MIYQPSLLFLALFSLSISAFAVEIASVTSVPQPYGVLSQVSVPEPTDPPAVHELRKRQNPQKTLIAAPDNTCGFFNGSSDQPWGCSTGNCFFETMTLLAVNSVQIGANDTQTVAASTSTKVGSVLCCDPKTGCPSAPAPTACVDLGRNDYNKTCTGSCPTDSATLKCTSGIYRYCNTIAFQDPDISAYFCNYISTYAVLSAETTFTGQTGRAFTPTVAQFAISSTSTSFNSSSATSSTTAVATKAPPSPKKSVDKGPIIGGVVGGVIGLALVIGGLVWFRKWRNTPYPVKADGAETPKSEQAVLKAKK